MSNFSHRTCYLFLSGTLIGHIDMRVSWHILEYCAGAEFITPYQYYMSAHAFCIKNARGALDIVIDIEH